MYAKCRCCRADQEAESCPKAAERIVVCENEELPAFQHQVKVADGGVDSQQLPVERAVAGLSFFEKKERGAQDERQKCCRMAPT